VVRLAEHKTAHKGKQRVLYLCPEAVALLREQRQRYGSGYLFRSRHGTRYTKNSIGLAFRRLRERAGVEHATAYAYRHTFATDALSNGVPDAQVAELLGHSGTAMLHKHYAHLGARARVLREALQRVAGVIRGCGYCEARGLRFCAEGRGPRCAAASSRRHRGT
jgi:integrase